MNAEDTALRFIDCINSGSADAVAGMMTDDHLFVDGCGREVIGRSDWQSYFDMFPDYEVAVSNIFCKGNRVGIFGKARGTAHKDGSPVEDGDWEIPASWFAVVRDNLIAEWRVYADNDAVRKILTRHGIKWE